MCFRDDRSTSRVTESSFLSFIFVWRGLAAVRVRRQAAWASCFVGGLPAGALAV